jgi:uncharacterized protein YbjT (DUF2867 family)
MILVTGATGTVGSALVHRLAAGGERPRALVRDLDKARQRLGDEAELVLGDLSDPDTISAALHGVDRVFLLTATTADQFEQERNGIEAARRAEVAHLVKLSVLGASEDSPMRHARWQRQADRLLEESGLEHTILQMAFFMQTLFGMVNGGAIFSSAGDGKIAMIDARDAAAVAAAVLTGRRPQGTVALSGPQALSFDDTAGILSAATGLAIRHVRVSSADVANAIRRFRAEEWYATDVATFNDLIAAGDTELVTDNVRELTGTPARSLAEFAAEFAEVFTRRPQFQAQP